MKLNKEEKDYLYLKLEYKKKKKAIESKNNLFNLLKGDKTNFNNNEIQTIIRSLEFTFRKRLEGTKPDLKNKLFLSIKGKLPSDIIIVKQSKIGYKPTKSASKIEIINYLKSKKIPYDKTNTKSKLLSLLEKIYHVKKFNEFINK